VKNKLLTAAGLFCLSFALTTCGRDSPLLPDGITWQPVPYGGPPTTAINLIFSSDPGDLSAGDIIIDSAGGAVTRTGFSGGGTLWVVGITVQNPGYVSVNIDRQGIESRVQAVRVADETENGGDVGDNNPAVARFQRYMSRQTFEEMFPRRNGSPGWRAEMPHPHFPDWQNFTDDYFSYDNLLEAIRFMSNLEVREYSRGGLDLWNSPTHNQWDEWNTETRVLNRATGGTVIIRTGSEFNAPHLAGGTLVGRTVVNFGNFLNHASPNDRIRELAAFFANASHETSASGAAAPGSTAELGWSFFYKEEIAYRGATSSPYNQYEYLGVTFPPVPGQSYHGRGPFQLSWNTNYALFSMTVLGNRDLLNRPATLLEDGVLGWKSAIWFWMHQPGYRPSMHQVISGNWSAPQQAIARGWSANPADFGYTIMVINGGLEGNLTEADGRIARRAAYYRAFLARLGGNPRPGERLHTAGVSTFW